LRLIFAVHNHQPVGNFGNVFEDAYRDSYGPFLELLEQFPDIPFALHTSGPLMEWLVENRPDYVARLRQLVARGQVEILGGGFYEPILTMIPPRDRIGQITSYRTYLEDLLHTRVRGIWTPERVWEQNLVSDLAAAGVEYTVLDDYHFRQSGLEDDQLFGHYLTEDNGRLLRIFPGSERMRYLVPFRDPEETLHFLGSVAGREPDAVIVCADDGEKLGSWPGTHQHCYTNGWLRRWLEVLRSARSWVRLCTFAQALDETPDRGKVYLADCSYREMTEWALPLARREEYQRLGDLPENAKRHLRNGYWRNFKVRYPETEEMYARMLQVSQRLEQAEDAEPQLLQSARQDLYRAQCNCPWWHGSFGGLYLPHLRNAVYRHLIAAESWLLFAEGRSNDWLETEVADLNLDGRPEVSISTSRLAAYFQPDRGGCLYELDLRAAQHNLLATLARRPEPYHEGLRRQEHVRVKQGGLADLLHYDSYLRKSFIDHFYDPGLTLAQVLAGQESERGDFVSGVYEYQVRREEPGVVLVLSRQGTAAGRPVRLSKEIQVLPDSDMLEVRYVLEGCPSGRGGGPAPLHFAVECNFAGMAAGADDRYFYHDRQARAGQLQSTLDLGRTRQIGLVDEWLGLDASLTLSRPGGIWTFPIQTVSGSEGGVELVHQSTAVLLHWLIEPDSAGRWETTLTMKLDMSRAEARLLAAAT